VSQYCPSPALRIMSRPKSGLSWLAWALMSAIPACSSSGRVLETKQGTPSPSNDGGTKASPADAGAPSADGGTPEEHSGARIAVTGYFSGETLLQVKSVHDKAHDVDCELALADDGATRCLPLRGAVVYRGADCTDPVIVVDKFSGFQCPGAPPLPGFISYSTGGACPAPSVHVVGRGASAATPAQVYTSSAGVCAVTFQYEDAGAQFFETVPSAPADWVAFHRDVTVITPALGIEAWRGDDGSRLQGGMTLLPDDTPCVPLAPDSDERSDWTAVNRCIPIARGSEGPGFYSDDGCANAVTYTPECQPLVLSVTSEVDSSSCSHYTYRAVGRSIPNASVYTNVLGPCRVAESVLGGTISYERGAVVDTATYPEVKGALLGGGAVQPLAWQSDGTSFTLLATSQSNGLGVDSASGQRCALASFDDGSMRCAVLDYDSPSTWFADAACNQPLYSWPFSPCVLGGPSGWVFEEDLTLAGCSLPIKTSGRPIGGPHAGAIYTKVASTGAPCTEYDAAADTTAQPLQLYDLGDPQDATKRFAEITTREL